MSVIKSKRTTSAMEFLATARKLEAYTIQKCTKFPKRYTFYISIPLSNMSISVYANVVSGNTIYPLNQHEVQLRRDCFIKANEDLNSMVSQLELANELFGIDKETMREWSEMINTEIRLVKSVMKSDRSRYKDMP